MRQEYTFTITVDIDAEKAESLGDSYLRAFKESADEFADELNQFLEKHPFVQCARMEKK